MDEFAGALQLAKKGVDRIRTSQNKGEDKYEHITEDEIKQVERTVQEKWNWLEEKRIQLNQTARTQQPPIYCNQIRTEKQVSTRIVHRIVKISFDTKNTSITLMFLYFFSPWTTS